MTAEDLNRRLGKFYIPEHLLRERPDDVHKIMDGMIVVRAEQHYARQAIEYIAMSEKFSPVETYQEVPCYRFIIGRKGDISFDYGR